MKVLRDKNGDIYLKGMSAQGVQVTSDKAEAKRYSNTNDDQLKLINDLVEFAGYQFIWEPAESFASFCVHNKESFFAFNSRMETIIDELHSKPSSTVQIYRKKKGNHQWVATFPNSYNSVTRKCHQVTADSIFGIFQALEFAAGYSDMKEYFKYLEDQSK